MRTMRLYSHLILLIPLLLPLLTTSNNNLLDTYLLPNHPHEMSGARLGLPCLLINTSTRRDLSGFEYADAALALPPPPRAHKKKSIGHNARSCSERDHELPISTAAF